MTGIKVRLSKSDIAKAEQASALRYQLARSAGVKDRLVDTSRSGKSADLPGLKAEIAVAKLMGADFDPSVLGIDSGCDLYIACGPTEVGIQVKSTHHKSAEWLLGTPHAKANWDVSVFVRPTNEDAVMEVSGWISAKEYEEKLQTIDLGHGPGTGVHIDDLRPMEELWRSINVKRSSEWKRIDT